MRSIASLHSTTSAFQLVISGILFVVLSCNVLYAQKNKEAPKQVTIEREPMRVLAPEKYQFRFHLEPHRRTELIAATSGFIRQISAKLGHEVGEQVLVSQLNDEEHELLVKLATSKLELAKAKQPSETTNKEMLQHEISVAELELELAKLNQERTRIYAPFAGKVERILREENTFVLAGTPVITLIDESVLTVQVPVEREKVEIGGTLSLQVESKTVEAKVINISAVPSKWDPLRELAGSVAMATCEVENKSGANQSGQTVLSDLIPRYPVAEVPLDAITNGTRGGRQVQVIREQAVRNIAVKALGEMGEDRLFVSGLFAEGDELITKSSEELKEGTLVQSAFEAGTSKRRNTSKSSSRQDSSNSKKQEF